MTHNQSTKPREGPYTMVVALPLAALSAFFVYFVLGVITGTPAIDHYIPIIQMVWPQPAVTLGAFLMLIGFFVTAVPVTESTSETFKQVAHATMAFAIYIGQFAWVTHIVQLDAFTLLCLFVVGGSIWTYAVLHIAQKANTLL